MNLKLLRKHGFKAEILTEKTTWKSEPALWIECDSTHPVGTLEALPRIWDCLRLALSPFAGNVGAEIAIDYFWPNILLVQTVKGKSLSQHCWANFGGALYGEKPLEECIWRAFPEIVPEETWFELGQETWPLNSNVLLFEKFSQKYSQLFSHLSHIGDFNRLPEDIDEKGLALLQSYINEEVLNLMPIFQEAMDTCGELLEVVSSRLDSFEEKNDLLMCLELLMQVGENLAPTEDFNGEAKLNLEQISIWSNALKEGLESLGVAGMLWVACSYGLPDYIWPEVE